MNATRIAGAALGLLVALAACNRTEPQVRGPGGNAVENAEPAPPGSGKLKVRQVYDFVGDRAGTPWAGFEQNGDYDYPEPIVGGWPIRVTPVDAAGNPTGNPLQTTTLQELSPTDGRYLELPAGRYRVEELWPVSAEGGASWERTGANLTQGGATTSLGAVASALVEVTAGTTEGTASVVRFFSVCRVGGAVQPFPASAVADVAGGSYPCRPSFETTPPPPPPPAPGELDQSFGTGGKVVVDFAGSRDEALDVAAQPDGKLVAVGLSSNPGDTETQARLALVRLDAAGGLDPSFGQGGRVRLPVGDFAAASGVALQPDGKIVVAGYVREGDGSDRVLVARFNANGSPDPGFGAGGVVALQPPFGPERANDVAVQPDGKIVAAGWSFSPNPDLSGVTRNFLAVRLDAAGALDPSFGSGGRVVLDFSLDPTLESNGEVRALALAPDGGIVLAGSAADPTGQVVALGRLRPDGSLDAVLSGDGTRRLRAPGATVTIANAVALLAGGKVLVGGYSLGSDGLEGLTVARLERDGDLDPTFGTNGFVIASALAGGDRVNALAVQPDGKVLAAGFAAGATAVGGGAGRLPADFQLVRLTASGALDAGFGSGGRALADFSPDPSNPTSADRAEALVLLPDGRAVLAGSAQPGGESSDFALTRHLP